VIEEMGHMALAANILTAIGGQPSFTALVPNYPDELPFKIGDRDGNLLKIHLAPFSKELVHDTFMAIEEPDDPIVFPVRPHVELFAAMGATQETFKTIGDFYRDLASKLTELGEGAFTGADRPQPAGFPGDVFPVRSLADALRAIDLIVQQGEGTTTKPLAGSGKLLAHYYRFEQIWKGFKLVPDATVPEGYSFSGPAIPYDPSGVANIVTDAKTANYAPGSRALFLARQFDGAYATLLRALDETYAGRTHLLTNSIGLMYDLMNLAMQLMQQPVDPQSAIVPPVCAAPTFEFPVPVPYMPPTVAGGPPASAAPA
jgi:hypothetical protein